MEHTMRPILETQGILEDAIETATPIDVIKIRSEAGTLLETPSKEEITGTLEHWRVVTHGDESRIWGAVYGDIRDRFKDGTSITTSSVDTKSQSLKEGAIVKTRYSVYKLGEPSVMNTKKEEE